MTRLVAMTMERRHLTLRRTIRSTATNRASLPRKSLAISLTAAPSEEEVEEELAQDAERAEEAVEVVKAM